MTDRPRRIGPPAHRKYPIWANLGAGLIMAVCILAALAVLVVLVGLLWRAVVWAWFG